MKCRLYESEGKTVSTLKNVKREQKTFAANGSNAQTSSILKLQQSIGNQVVQRFVDLSRKSDEEGGVTPKIESAINRSRGGGQQLDSGVQSQMNSAFNADFSGVRVHANAESHSLNRSLNAKAFTTGQDIFFRQGEYKPGTSSGRELLAHELTHVVQQNGDKVQRKDDSGECESGVCGGSSAAASIRTKLTVGQPNGIYEKEADDMANAFSAWEKRGGQTSGKQVQRQGAEEEKKEETPPVQTKSLDGTVMRQSEEEKKEEVAQKKPEEGIQRQEEEEEEAK